MICRNCNTMNADNAKFCAKCGAPMFTNNQPQNAQPYVARPVVPAEVQPAKGLSIAGMILGILSLVCCALIPGILGIVFGCVAKGKGNTSGMSTTSIICGAIGTVFGIIFLILYCIGLFSMPYYYY